MVSEFSRGAQLLAAWQGARKQRKVASLLELDETMYSRMVRGHRKPTLEAAVEIERKTAGAVPAISWMEPPCRARR
jgi:DNA-binding transcriptional regulator YdaS (Cro superfamily)